MTNILSKLKNEIKAASGDEIIFHIKSLDEYTQLKEEDNKIVLGRKSYNLPKFKDEFERMQLIDDLTSDLEIIIKKFDTELAKVLKAQGIK